MSQMEKYRVGCSQPMEWLMTSTMTVWLVASFQVLSEVATLLLFFMLQYHGDLPSPDHARIVTQYYDFVAVKKLLLHLFPPLCSMSIAISSVVLPYWAWGETDDVAVGLFKCCNFTEENRNSTISECSPLSDCFPSESNVYSLIKAAAGLQITYIVFHGITILLTIISQLIRDSDERKRCQFYNGMVVFLAASICFISIIVSFSGVIQSHSLKGVPPRLSINLAIFSCAVYISYTAVCLREPTLCICVPISIAVTYLAIYMMTNKLVLKSVSVVGGLAIACLLIYLIFARPDRCRTNV